MGEIDDVRAALASIQDDLLALRDDEWGEKFRLIARRDELRSQVREAGVVAELQRPDEDILYELKARRSKMAELEKQQINMISQSVWTFSAEDWDVSRQLDDALGIESVQSRIERLKSILDDRGVEYPAA